MNTCNAYLADELASLPTGAVVLALGTVAHRAVLKAFALRQIDLPFAHGAIHRLGTDRWLVDSYHCSRYNTQTRRLTPEMFRAALADAKRLALAAP